MKCLGYNVVHSTDLLKEEGNVLFKDAFNTFIYGHMASGIW